MSYRTALRRLGTAAALLAAEPLLDAENIFFVGDPTSTGYRAVRIEDGAPKQEYSRGESEKTFYTAPNTGKPLIEPDGFAARSDGSTAKRTGNQKSGQYPLNQEAIRAERLKQLPTEINETRLAIDRYFRINNLPRPGIGDEGAIFRTPKNENREYFTLQAVAPSEEGKSRDRNYTKSEHPSPAPKIERYGPAPMEKGRYKVAWVDPFSMKVKDLVAPAFVRGASPTAADSVTDQKYSTAVNKEYRRVRRHIESITDLDSGSTAMYASRDSKRNQRASLSPTGGVIDLDGLGVTTEGNGSTVYRPAAANSALSAVTQSSGSTGYKSVGVDYLQGAVPQSSPSSPSGLALPQGYGARSSGGIITDLSSAAPSSLVLTENSIVMAAAPPIDYAAMGNSAPRSTIGTLGGGIGTLSDTIVPWNVDAYIATDWSNLGQIASTPSVNNSTIRCLAQGLVTYTTGGNVPSGNSLIFYDKGGDKQVVGWFDIAAGEPGLYDFVYGTGYGMFYDDQSISGDQGWINFNEIGVVLKSSDGKYYNAYFTGTAPEFDFGSIGGHDIKVTDEILWVPEPSTGALVLGGAGLLTLRRRRNSRSYTNRSSGSHPHKQHLDNG